ncbi:MAG: protein-export membrane protein SecD [Candidatus Riflebacteria bacterium GWC2_50_8]|nr:MAG: protein-export membrane protein SecD [Candidatus Riflebacteria bacterium GWC2_50_8]
MWDNAFGTISPAEQYAVPQRLLEYSAGDDGASALIKFQVDRMAEIFNRVKDPARTDDVLNNVVDTARKALVDMGAEVRVFNPDYVNGNVSLRVAGKSKDEAQALLNGARLYSKLPLIVTSLFPRSKITLGLDLKGGIDLVYQVDLNSIQENDSITDAVSRSVEIIRNRIDMFGIAEPSIKSQDGNRIRIQLPGVKDPERVKQLIQNTAMLQFHMVKDQALTAAQLEPISPEGEIVLMQPGTNRQQAMWFKLVRKPEVTGRDLKYAKVSFDDMGAPIVHLEFNAEGAAKFAQVTGSHIGEQLAIVLDNKVHSAPVIQSRITGGMAQITGRFSLEEAQNLAIVLRAGALPASLIALESRVVGPTLGQESIKAGWSAGIIGTLLVLLFMAFFYKFCGILADMAVLFNTLIIFAVLVFFGGTLTLPGIAGLILTIGFAVDANVIIFERIKEEFRSGKTVRAAINAGFDRAFTCIIDSNVTTLLTVAILYIFGSGPIRGFATTLGVGLIANVFTAIICVKLALDLYYSGERARTLSI